MPAIQQPSVPWGANPFAPSVAFGQPGTHVAAPIAYLVQQLQQVQQAEYIQQQQLQMIQQLLQVIPQQVQQLQAVVQVLPHQVAQIVQQVIVQSSLGSPITAGFGAAPFAGLATSPLQSPAFGVPFSSLTPGPTPSYSPGQPGYVM
jgi:4-diphosphocytidyl-2C-methyl-D-erythritol kinase